MPLTSQMVKNFAKEIIRHAVNKNWSRDFVTRHKRRLKSLYLHNIDNLRVKGEYPLTYKLFFDTVSVFTCCVLVVI